jgi:hypothetical protein
MVNTSFIRSLAQEKGTVEIKSLDETCQLYLDNPMIADELYGGKKITSTIVKISEVREIPFLCPDEAFTAEIVSAKRYVVECVCNSANNKSILDTSNVGKDMTVVGEFKSMSSSFFEDNTQMCKISLNSCSFSW